MEAINIRSSIKIIPSYFNKSAKFAIILLDGYLDTYNSPAFQEYIHKLEEVQ